MLAFGTDRFRFTLPEGHRFPARKYPLLREMVVQEQLADLRTPAAATVEELELAHDPAYVAAALDGTLPPAAWRRIGFPWSPEFAERSCRSVGGTIEACRAALDQGVAVHLAGGTHHAFRDRGEGYCVFNDIAVALRVIQRERRVARAIVIDCDVHQGNGTAAIFAGDPGVFTFSIHGAKNFPFRKEESDLDVALPEGTRDDAYLSALTGALEVALPRSEATFAVYLAGADAWEGDRLGKLGLTRAGLAERDRLVFESCRAAGLPVAVTMGGGYAPDPLDTARIHLETVRIAKEVLS